MWLGHIFHAMFQILMSSASTGAIPTHQTCLYMLNHNHLFLSSLFSCFEELVNTNGYLEGMSECLSWPSQHTLCVVPLCIVSMYNMSTSSL